MTDQDGLAVAVIGAGFIADYHVGGIRAAGGRVTHLVGRSPERTRARADALGIARASTDLDAVLAAPEVSAVVVATPDATHREVACRALAARKPVLLQKPMALTGDECRAVLREAKRSGTPLTVSFMHRFFPEVRWLKRLLDGDTLGRIHALRVRNATPGADWADWFYAPEAIGGGVVMQLGVHGIDLVQHLFGPVERVTAIAATMRPERRLSDGRTVRTGLEDNVAATYALASGALATHEMSYTELAGCDRFRLEVYAERGTVWLRSTRGAAAIHAPEVTGRDGWVTPDLPSEPMGQAHHAAWLEIAAGSRPPDDTAGAGLSTILVAETIYRAAAARVERTVPQVAPG